MLCPRLQRTLIARLPLASCVALSFLSSVKGCILSLVGALSDLLCSCCPANHACFRCWAMPRRSWCCLAAGRSFTRSSTRASSQVGATRFGAIASLFRYHKPLGGMYSPLCWSLSAACRHVTGGVGHDCLWVLHEQRRREGQGRPFAGRDTQRQAGPAALEEGHSMTSGNIGGMCVCAP